jgi:hypothetical protein
MKLLVHIIIIVMFCGYVVIEAAHDTKWRIYSELFTLRYQSLLQTQVQTGLWGVLHLSLEPRVGLGW